MKRSCSSPILSYGFPNKFGQVLTTSRSLTFDQFPDYASVRRSLVSLAERMSHIPDSGPPDWTPFDPQIPTFVLDVRVRMRTMPFILERTATTGWTLTVGERGVDYNSISHWLPFFAYLKKGNQKQLYSSINSTLFRAGSFLDLLFEGISNGKLGGELGIDIDICLWFEGETCRWGDC